MRAILAVVLLSLAVRATIPYGPALTGIAQFYADAGDSIRAGNGYPATGEYVLPGFALLRAVAPDPVPLQLLLDGVLGPLLLYFAVKGRAGLLAALLYALALPVAAAAHWQLPDSMTTLLCLCAVCPVLIWRDWRGALVSGVALGAAGWMRGDFLALVPLEAVVILAVTRRVSCVAGYLLCWLVFAVALGLFWRTTYGYFAITRPGAGLNLYEGLGEEPNSWGIAPSDEQAGALLSTNSINYGTAAGDTWLFAEYVRDARQAPLEVLGQVVRRFGRVVTLDGADWGIYVTHWQALVYGLIVFSAVGFWRKRRSPVAWTFAALWLSRAVPFSVLHTEPRYIIVLLACYVVGAALCVDSLRVRTKRSAQAHSHQAAQTGTTYKVLPTVRACNLPTPHRYRNR